MLYMNKRGIPGIPYFGLNHNEVEEEIIKAPIIMERAFSSLYDCVQTEKSADKIVIVEYDGKEWLTYLRDIRFNYRDKKVFIPFYTFEIQEINKEYQHKYEGHILSLDNGKRIGIRYNYCLREHILDIDSKNYLILYDFKSRQKYRVDFYSYYDFNNFDIEELYQLYIDYCKDYEDSLIYKHTEGYHIISRNVQGMTNYERLFREELGLSDYLNSDVNLFYRDVRNLSEREFTVKLGLDLCNKPYWERRLDFESLLYCIIANGALPEGSFRKEWLKLGKTKDFIKYGDKEVKLIFKSYWLPNFRNYQRKSWSRV